MCLVIDINTLPCVFNKNNQDHEEFKPVYNWILSGKGKVIFGGSKYIKELGERYIKFFNLLKAQGKAIRIPDNHVDLITQQVTLLVTDADFDDQHIVALLIVSKCKLICSADKRAYPYFRHSTFFKPANNKPRIYSSKNNSSLLDDRFIVEVCKPCLKVNNDKKNSITQMIEALNTKKQI